VIFILKLGFDITQIMFLRHKNITSSYIIDPIWFSVLAQIAGIDILILHLDKEEKLISSEELELIRRTSKVPINLKLTISENLSENTGEIFKFNPEIVTLYSKKGLYHPLSLEEILNLRHFVEKLKQNGIKSSAFINPEVDLIREAVKNKFEFIELNVEKFFNSVSSDREKEYEKLLKSARFASTMRSRIIIGHGINYQSLTQLLSLPALEEIHVGRSIIARALVIGLNNAIREMIEIINLKS
jgi:pyridoxine 5-phosphate synthase